MIFNSFLRAGFFLLCSIFSEEKRPFGLDALRQLEKCILVQLSQSSLSHFSFVYFTSLVLNFPTRSNVLSHFSQENPF